MKLTPASTRRAHAAAFVAAFGVAFVATVAACSGGSSGAGPGDGAATGADASAACPLCVTDQDCNGGVCAQFGSDSYCAPSCPNGDECTPDRACTTVTTAEGQQASVCVPRGDVCGPSAAGPSAPPPPSNTCGTLVGPDVTAGCRSCTSGGSKPCQANGCYGGWWCDTATNRCQSPPTTCATGGDGGALHVDAGGPVTGTVGANGGSVSRLFFAVVGDTRPATINDTAGYPSAIIKQIYDDVEASTPRPSFVVSTGDYIFTSTSGGAAATQMDLYLAARQSYSGVVFPAMGNHECTGKTDSNCGPGNPDGVTANYTAFLDKLLSPIGKSSPSYEVDVNANDGSWTSKFVFVAGNAWTSADAAWLDQTLSKPTTYTFVVRHEPKNAYQAPGCSASEPIMANHPYTLAIVGHTHAYYRSGPKQVTIGNGGAPLTSGNTYGYAVLSQRSDGAIQVDMIDYATGQPDLGFRFAVRPDGSSAP